MNGQLIENEQFLADLGGLVNDQHTADVLFIVDKDEVPLYAHKLMLWARCRLFKKYDHQFWRVRNTPGPLTFKYPQYDHQIFLDALRYVYTGRIRLTDTTVFSTLVISRDFGIEELRKVCESFITSRLASHNVCDFLSAALQLQHESTVSAADESEFVESCMRFIEQNADSCVKTTGWLELPKDALIKLISSQQFALEEEDVWRAVLGWAKYNAGIPLDKKPKAWTEHEKSLVSKALTGVIEHIKLLLIDSAVFAEEVEPTGIVPMEVSLARYRYAAVPNQTPEQTTEDVRLLPRVSLKLFHDTEILSKDNMHFQRLLNKWYGSSKQEWKLLYRASRDGFSSDSFHRKCDGFSITYTVVKGQGENACICGGFSDVPWTSNTPPRGRFIPSHRAFLFTLENNQGVAATKFDVVNSKLATLHHPSYGPVFGAGADLCVSSSCNTGMESYSNFPHTYGGEDASQSILMGDYNFNIADYEVFTVINNGGDERAAFRSSTS